MRKRNKRGERKNICAKCNINPVRSAGQRYCKSCHAEYMRLNRPKHSELNSEQKKKSLARSTLNVYIKRGVVVKQPCLICGKKAEAHHDDYNKPLEVKWYCRMHHLEIHKNQKNGIYKI